MNDTTSIAAPRRRFLHTGAAALLAGAAFVLLAACDRPATGPGPGPKATAGFNAVDITGANYGQQTTLPDTDGKPRSLADFKGKVTVVFFGYTQCPDVCPTTLAELAQIKKALGAEGERLQGVFITLDPERDTPEVLKGYVKNFDAGFVALRGTPEQTTAAAKDFKVFFQKVPGKTADSYTMDHTAGSYVFDAKGQLRLFTRYSPGTAGTTALTEDVKRLLAQG